MENICKISKQLSKRKIFEEEFVNYKIVVKIVKDCYKEDLAYIHDLGFSEYALKSAPGILKILQNNNIKKGLIVDLGCGSGLSAQEFIKAHYHVLGIDISQSMVNLARNRVPKAEFRVESLFKTKIPPCNAVTSIGECLNYLFDEDNNDQNLLPESNL